MLVSRHQTALWWGFCVVSLLAPVSPAVAVSGSGDVAEVQDFTEALQWSADNNIAGVDGNCFAPDDPNVSRCDNNTGPTNTTSNVETVQADEQTYTSGGEFTSVSAGWSHSCGVKTDNTVTCWGNNDNGQSVAPAGEFTSVSAGSSHSCGVKTDNTVTCWGRNNDGQSVAPAGEFTSVSAGRSHSCGVKTDNTVTCWGSNDNGQSDAPAGEFTSVSYACGVKTDNTITCWYNNSYEEWGAPAGEFTSVSASGDYACGVKTDNTITCWGNKFNRKRGAPGEFTSVSAGWSHSCGIKTDNTLTCWGNRPDSPAYGGSVVPGEFTAVSVGEYHLCAVKTDNTVTCWGNNDRGQSVAPAGEFTSVSAGGLHEVGWSHSCGVKTDNTVTCWGYTRALGESNAPAGEFTSVSASTLHSCGVKTDNTITCWGNNDNGQSDAPAGEFTAVSAGRSHSCGVKTDNTVTCWGSNFSGQRVAPAGEFKSVSAGWYHSCGVRSDNTVTCWGRNDDGESVAPAGEFTSVSAGGSHSCGVRTDSIVTCWGRNDDGQSVAPAGEFTSVSAGGSHSCGVRSDSIVTCWGRNDDGESVAPAGEFTAVSAGDVYSCGVRSDGGVMCWGAIAVFIPSGNSGGGGASVRVAVGGLGPTEVGPGQGVACGVAVSTCRHVNVVLRGFAPGIYSVSCAHDGWGRFGPSEFWTFSLTVGESGSAMREGVCFLDFAQLTGNGVYVTVGRSGFETVRSNWLQAVTGTAVTGTGDSMAPGVPRNVRAAAHGARKIRVTWDPPSSSGSSPISHYLFQYSGSAVDGDRPWSTKPVRVTGRSYISGNLRFSTVYTVTVTAVNGDNRSSTAVTTKVSTAAQAGAPPSEPRNVRAFAHGARKIRVTWDPPSSSGSSPISHYLVQYSRAGTPGILDGFFERVALWISGKIRVTGTSHTPSWNLSYGTTYNVAVVAVNEDDRASSPATSTATTNVRAASTELGQVKGIRYTIGKRQERDGVIVSVDSVSWERVAGATSYEFKWKWPLYPRTRFDDDIGFECDATECSAEFERPLENDSSLVLSIRATRGSDSGDWTAADPVDPEPCPVGQKYRRANISGRGGSGKEPHMKIIARRSFAIPGRTDIQIREHEEGGHVRAASSLSQEGCSWVEKGSRVSRKAIVSENALIRDGSIISHSATVSGDAIVSDAIVEGNAVVTGNAEISGGAVIKGDAKIFGNAKIYGGTISTGEYDGVKEFIRVYEKTYVPAYKELFHQLASFPHDKHDLIKRLHDYDFSSRSPDGDGEYLGSIRIGGILRIIRAVIPDLTALIPVPGKFGTAVQGIGAVIALKNLSDIADQLAEDSNPARIRDTFRAFERLYAAVYNDPFCKRDCKTKLVNIKNEVKQL